MFENKLAIVDMFYADTLFNELMKCAIRSTPRICYARNDVDT